MTKHIVTYTYDVLRNIYQGEYEIHPKAELTDYYKLFFQAYYGQGHFMESRVRAMQYLEEELAGMQGLYLPLVQDIGHESGLYRVSLTVLSRQLLTFDQYIDRFCAVQTSDVNWIKWQHQWTVIESILLDSYGLSINNEQRLLCNSAIEQKHHISHSENFRLTYNPHYRVMQLNWDDELLRKLHL